MSQFSESNNQQPDERQSKYLSKIPEGTILFLQYQGFLEKIGEPSVFSNPDGSYGEWRFADINGKEKIYTHKNAKNSLSTALKDNNVNQGEYCRMLVTSQGDATKKFRQYKVQKVTPEQFAQAKLLGGSSAQQKEIKVDEIPF